MAQVMAFHLQGISPAGCPLSFERALALYVYEILLFLSAPYGGRLLNLTVGFLTLPAAACECQKSTSVHHRSLLLPGWHKRPVSAYS